MAKKLTSSTGYFNKAMQAILNKGEKKSASTTKKASKKK